MNYRSRMCQWPDTRRKSSAAKLAKRRRYLVNHFDSRVIGFTQREWRRLSQLLLAAAEGDVTFSAIERRASELSRTTVKPELRLLAAGVRAGILNSFGNDSGRVWHIRWHEIMRLHDVAKYFRAKPPKVPLWMP